MSAKIMGAVWDLNLASHLKFVLLAYADHADHDGGNVFPAVASIAKKCGISERQVQSIVKQLAEKRYMVRENSGKGGRGVVNCWRICTNPDAEQTGFLKDETPKSTSPFTDSKTTKLTSPLMQCKRVKSSAERVKFATQKGEVQCGSPNRVPVSEPSGTVIEPSAAATRVDAHEGGAETLAAAAAVSSSDPPEEAVNSGDYSVQKPPTGTVAVGAETASLLDLPESEIAALAKSRPGELVERFREQFAGCQDPNGTLYSELLRQKTKAFDPSIRYEVVLQASSIETQWLRQLRHARTKPGSPMTPKLANTSPYRPYIGD